MLSQLVVDALAEVHRVAPRSHLAPFLRLVLVLGVVGAAGSRALTRSRVSTVLGGLAGAALAVALSLTLLRGSFGHESLGRLARCAVTDPAEVSADGLANLALFAPAGFLAVLAVGRPLLVALGLAVVSVVVEGVQAVEWVGVCDSSDAVHNALGGLVAALAGAGLRRAALHLRSAVPGSGSCHRSC